MVLEEFLLKIGVDASKAGEIAAIIALLQSGADRLSDTANEMQSDINRMIQQTQQSTEEAGKSADEAKSKLSKLKLVIIGLTAASALYGKRVLRAFNNAIDKARELATQKGALFKISQRELIQAEYYKREMNRTGLALDSVKTKIALNLAPALTRLIAGFRNWLTVNKELIADGITKVIKAVGMAIQVVVNFVKFIDKIISGTIGWKNALIALGIAWAVLNRAFLFSPLGIILGLLTALMLLIDDLMVYMNGGKSLFGEYWQPFIDGAKAAWEFAKTFWEFLKALWTGDTKKIKSLSKSLFDSIVSGFKSLIAGIKSLLSKVFKNILMFFGMSERAASETVDRIGKIFNFIIDALTLPFRMSYKVICQIMDWLGADTGDSVNAIRETFWAIFEFWTAPFKAAWKFINDLFDIWEDDTTTTTDKIGETFWAIFDFVISPFKDAWNFVKSLFKAWVGDVGDATKKFAETFLKVHESITAPFKNAMDWIRDKFYGFIDSVKSKVKEALSWIGLGGDDDEIEVTAKRLTNTNIQAKLSTDGAKAGSFMPANKNINNNNAVTINNTMNVTTPQDGFDSLNSLSNNAVRNLADNTQTALGYN
ncbi:hypothetical protein A9G34_01030 [Gilliamella sp. Choc4-2]|uniref:phage tail protein n=1 Tax=Gilliamella sp. Choc4-2 TaxID=3120237 RepID=UPI00080DF848|nr:hypothetical protein [Gilliamella apicola]OCG45714.1 hypothetical protein A9G34_01030 [Gilliamella apicola]